MTARVERIHRIESHEEKVVISEKEAERITPLRLLAISRFPKTARLSVYARRSLAQVLVHPRTVWDIFPPPPPLQVGEHLSVALTRNVTGSSSCYSSDITPLSGTFARTRI